MNEGIRDAVDGLMRRIERPGTRVEPEELRAIRDHVDGCLPAWFVALVSEFPLAGIRIGVRVTDAFAGLDDEPVMFEWGDAALMQELNLHSYPGMYLFPRAYLAVACGVERAGNILVMETRSVDPALYEVWHDISHDPTELEHAIRAGAPGTRLISSTLSGLFSHGLVAAPWGSQ